ncbi:MAG: hypothetical protein M1537_04590 [Nitrospirae bacterium]|nr:hypothetical protein [Nitrospirota bacterium]
MEPVGQKSSFPEGVPSQNALSYGFLLRLVDLSRALRPGPPLSLTLPATLLIRSLDSSSPLPVRFDLKTPEGKKALDALLSPLSPERSPTLVSLEVTREGDHLLWRFRGSGREALLSSPLLLVRPSLVPLEDVQRTQRADASLSERTDPFLPSPGLVIAPAMSPDEPIAMRGGALALSSPGALSSMGPVSVWPSFFPGRTIELSVRWNPEEEGEGPAPGRPRGNVVFSLDIPWGKKAGGSPAPDKVRLAGSYGPDGLTLRGRNLPEDFIEHFRRRQTILSESLRVFPGVEIFVHLQGRESGNGEVSGG